MTYLDYTGTRDGSGQWQSPTDAQGGFADVALNWKISEIAYAKFTVQYTHLDPVYRYYRPTQENENLRVAVAGTIEFVDLERRVGFADNVRLTLYYQDKEDQRRWYDAATNALTQEGVAKWQTVQIDVQADKQLGCHALTYGIEFESTAGREPGRRAVHGHVPDGTKEKPAPDSIWSSLGVYVQDGWKVTRWLTLTGSARFDLLRFETDVDAYYDPPGGVDPGSTSSRTGSRRSSGVCRPTPLGRNTNVYGGWTRGFRQFAPRFGSWSRERARRARRVPRSRHRRPVRARRQAPRRVLPRRAVGYYTKFHNFQNVVPGTFLGSDWYDFDGDGVRDPDEDVYVIVGNGSAYVYGVELPDVNLAAIDPCIFGEAWTVSGGFTWNYGQDETNDIPMRHTHPCGALPPALGARPRRAAPVGRVRRQVRGPLRPHPAGPSGERRRLPRGSAGPELRHAPHVGPARATPSGTSAGASP